MRKKSEDYIREYLDRAKSLGINVEPPKQQIENTAKAAWILDSYIVEPGDEPADKSPNRRTN